MPFIPHTDEETQIMLRDIGAARIEELFEEIPQSLINQDLSAIPEGLTEFEVKALIDSKLKQDSLGACFIGAGAYEHHIPSAVAAMINRGEFLTAYTPYQAEASQGNLQLIYEYQTMIASLMGMDAANASVYDGANALAEAILMAIRIIKNKNKVILLPRTIHPAYRKVVKTIVGQQGIQIKEINFNPVSGKTELEILKEYEGKDIAALVIPHPNFFGVLENVDALTDWAHQQNVLTIAVVNPVAVSLLKEPGAWGLKGADIACGEGQPLGIPLSSGGPYFGFMACKMKYIRQMPGRIVGRTVDMDGKEGFTLTLQAREQHIRRAKATSNICTNQGLMVTAATVHMSLLGATGLQQVASSSHAGARTLLQYLAAIEGITILFESPFFHEFVICLEQPIAWVLKQMAVMDIQGGYDLSIDYPELGNALLICVTETKSVRDIEHYCQVLRQVLVQNHCIETSEAK